MAKSWSISSERVWDRKGGENASHAMSKHAFAALVSFWTAFGVATSAFAAYKSLHVQLTWWLVIGVLVVSIAGILLAMWSDKPILSLLGYMMVTIPFGILVGPLVAHFTAASVVRVFLITSGMVVGLGVLGACWPRSLEHWGGWLFGGLLVLMLGLFIVPIAGLFGVDVRGAMTWLDWIGVVLFSGYVVYDLNRAMRVERTHDNAIDCAVAVYLDFVNIFVRLLSLTGDSKD